MTLHTESAIEDFAIKLFEGLGYRFVYAPDIAPDGEHPAAVLHDAIKEVERIHSPDLLADNESFHRHVDRRRQGQC